MNKLLISMALGLSLVSASANALTFKPNTVLTTNPDGTQSVVDAGSTETAQRILATNGYHVVGGSVIIAVGDESVTISTNELLGKSRDDIKQLIVDTIIDSGFASGGAIAADFGDATDAAQSAVDSVYADAVAAAVYADNIANGVADDISRDASNGRTFAEFCSDPNADGDKSNC